MSDPSPRLARVYSCCACGATFKKVDRPHAPIPTSGDLHSAIFGDTDIGAIRMLGDRRLQHDGDPSVPNVDAKDNAVLKLAEFLGRASTTSVDDPHYPNFSATKVKSVDPRRRCTGSIRTRTSRIQVTASRFLANRRRGFQPHPPMTYKYALRIASGKKSDIARYELIPVAHRASFWYKFAKRCNWWLIPPSYLSCRLFALDSHDCVWIHEQERRMIQGAPLLPSFLIKQELKQRTFNQFKQRVEMMKEAFWRIETGHWVSAHDTSWRYLSFHQFKCHFPAVSAEVQSLHIPIGLGVPVPPTIFYYGTRLAELQVAAPDNHLVSSLEECATQEFMILALARIVNEMRFGGRLWVLEPSAIARMSENLKDVSLPLAVPLPVLFSILSTAANRPTNLRNQVQFVVPQYSVKPMPESAFIWTLVPLGEVNPNAYHGQKLFQHLDDPNSKKDVIGTARPIGHRWPENLRLRIKPGEVAMTEDLGEFVLKEFDGTIPLLSVAELLERLSIRVLQKLEVPITYKYNNNNWTGRKRDRTSR